VSASPSLTTTQRLPSLAKNVRPCSHASQVDAQACTRLLQAGSDSSETGRPSPDIRSAVNVPAGVTSALQTCPDHALTLGWAISGLALASGRRGSPGICTPLTRSPGWPYAPHALLLTRTPHRQASPFLFLADVAAASPSAGRFADNEVRSAGRKSAPHRHTAIRAHVTGCDFSCGMLQADAPDHGARLGACRRHCGRQPMRLGQSGGYPTHPCELRCCPITTTARCAGFKALVAVMTRASGARADLLRAAVVARIRARVVRADRPAVDRVRPPILGSTRALRRRPLGCTAALRGRSGSVSRH
jgi:hypothetical protein